MKLTFRSVGRFAGKWLLPFIPGVGESLGEQLEKVAADPDKPTAGESIKALELLEKVRSLKPGVNSAEFVAFITCDGLLAKIVMDPSMPDGVRTAAAIALPFPAVGFMVTRAWQKKKKDEKS